jgi:hypothetical protein
MENFNFNLQPRKSPAMRPLLLLLLLAPAMVHAQQVDSGCAVTNCGTRCVGIDMARQDENACQFNNADPTGFACPGDPAYKKVKETCTAAGIDRECYHRHGECAQDSTGGCTWKLTHALNKCLGIAATSRTTVVSETGRTSTNDGLTREQRKALKEAACGDQKGVRLKDCLQPVMDHPMDPLSATTQTLHPLTSGMPSGSGRAPTAPSGIDYNSRGDSQ